MKNKFLLCLSFVFMACILIQPIFAFHPQNVRDLNETERRNIAKNFLRARKIYIEGKEFVKKGDMDKAMGKFLESVKTSPNFAESYMEIGHIYMKKGNYDKALEEYDNAANAYLRIEAYISRGILVKTADSRENDIFSRDLYRDLHEPKFSIPPKLYLYRGGAYFRKGMMSEALEQFTKTIELDPQNGEAHNNLAVIHFLAKEYDLAWEHVHLAQKHGTNINPKFIEDLRKVSPEPKKEHYPHS